MPVKKFISLCQMLTLTIEQQAQVNWLRGQIEEIGENKYRLTNDYRDESPSYEFDGDGLSKRLRRRLKIMLIGMNTNDRSSTIGSV
jgi:hypothetical protein